MTAKQVQVALAVVAVAVMLKGLTGWVASLAAALAYGRGGFIVIS